MPRDEFPHLDQTQLETYLASICDSLIKGRITSVSAAGVSTTRDASSGDMAQLKSMKDRVQYSLFIRTGGEDPRYPNPYTQKITRLRTNYSQFDP